MSHALTLILSDVIKLVPAILQVLCVCSLVSSILFIFRAKTLPYFRCWICSCFWDSPKILEFHPDDCGLAECRSLRFSKLHRSLSLYSKRTLFCIIELHLYRNVIICLRRPFVDFSSARKQKVIKKNTMDSCLRKDVTAELFFNCKQWVRHQGILESQWSPLSMFYQFYFFLSCIFQTTRRESVSTEEVCVCKLFPAPACAYSSTPHPLLHSVQQLSVMAREIFTLWTPTEVF